VLDGLFVTPAVTAIVEALGTANAEGTIAVVGNAKLAQALGATRTVIAVGLSPRAAKKFSGAIDSIDSIDAGSLAAVIGVDATDDAVRAWTRVTRDGGAIVLVDRGQAQAADASKRVLCAGLCELEQRHAGRLVITSGLVTHL
jgi:hypothetical protein